MKPGSKPTAEQYMSKANRVDMNVVGVQQEWMQIQNRREERNDQPAMVTTWKPPTPEEIARMNREYKVEDAHRENWEGRPGSATFEPGDSVIKE